MFSTFRYEPETPPDALDVPPLLKSRGIVDGVILGGVNYCNMVERMRLDRIPYTIFGNNFMTDGDPPANSVLFDDRDGAERAAEYLVSLDHSDIWFVGDTTWPWNRRRLDCYTAVMKRHRLTPRAITTSAATHHETGLDAMRAILDSREPCTAIFAANDYVASGVIEGARLRGLSVPQQLSVVGFDALDEFQYYRPGITTVGAEKESIGEQCVDLLFRQLESEDPVTFPNVLLPMRLIERESCAPLLKSRKR